MIAGLFLSSFLLRQLGDTEYGVYQTVASFANYLVLLEFGTGTVMARNLSVCRSNGDTQLQMEKNISTVWSITNILAAVIAAVSAIFYFSFGAIYSNALTLTQIDTGKQIFIFITIYLIASFYSQTLNGLMLAYEDYTYASSVSIVRILVRTALLVVLLLNWKHGIIIAIVDASINVVLAIFGYIYATKKFKIRINLKGFDKFILKSSMPLCLAIFLQAIVNQANNNVGKFILGVSMGPQDVSLYSVGLYIFSVFSSLSTIPLSLYVPQVTKDVTLGKRGQELTRSLVQPSRLLVIVGGAVLFGFFAIGKQFVEIVYGEKYLPAWAMALILIAPMFLNMTIGIVINVLDAMNKRLSRSIIIMVSTALNIGLTILLVNHMGVVGVALSTGVSMLLQVILLCIYYQKRIKINVAYLFYRAYKGILLYQIAGAIVGYAIGQFISNKYISLLVGGIVYCIISFGGFLLWGKNEEEALMINKITRKITRR
jgi:O-antigen/teichoic acid export membrane protein